MEFRSSATPSRSPTRCSKLLINCQCAPQINVTVSQAQSIQNVSRCFSYRTIQVAVSIAEFECEYYNNNDNETGTCHTILF